MKRILLAEDSLIVAEAVKSLLRSLGYDVVAVENGRKALDLLAAGEAFDLLVTDYEMPVMSGGEVLEALREREKWRTFPVIVHSGNDVQKQAAKYGAVFVRKSDTPALISAVKEILAS